MEYIKCTLNSYRVATYLTIFATNGTQMGFFWMKTMLKVVQMEEWRKYQSQVSYNLNLNTIKYKKQLQN